MRYAGALAVGTLVLVAACSDGSVPTQANDPAAMQPVEADAAPIAVMRLRTDIPLAPESGDAARNGSTKAGTSNSGIFYHNGPILTLPKTAAIYWSAGVIYKNGPAAGTTGNGPDGSLIGSLMGSLGSSPYWAINNTYTNGSGGRVATSLGHIGYWSVGSAPPSAPTDANMQALLNQGFSSGKLAWDPQAVYAIFTGPGVNLGGGFGSQYCAYHYWYTAPSTAGAAAGKVVKYAAMPYNADYPSGCTAQSTGPNGDNAADAEVNTLAHELEEAATDPQGTAWYDRRGYENADKCAWTFGTTSTAANGAKWNILVGGKQYLVQRNWKNVSGGGCFLQ